MIIVTIGLPSAIENMNKRVTHTPKRLARGLMAAGRQLQRDSMLIVPVDTGTLKRSATTVLRRAQKTVVVDVKYSTYYALAVHEILYYYHAPPTQAKFLSLPARTNSWKYARTVRNIVFMP